MTKKMFILFGLAATLFPVAALSAGVLEQALSDAQSAITLILATALVGGLFGFIAGRVDARAKAALAKAPEDRNLTDKLAIEADRRLDEIDRRHLTTVVDNVLSARIDRVAASLGLPPRAAADDFVDDFYAALQQRNPGLAGRLPIDADGVKDLIAAGIGRLTAPDALAEALRKIPRIEGVRSQAQV